MEYKNRKFLTICCLYRKFLIFLYIKGLKNILPSGFFDLILNKAIIPGDTVRNGR